MSKKRSRSLSPPDPNRRWNFDTNPFSIIGITLEVEATPENVKKKYHLKILSCHPDKQGHQTDTATEVTTAYNFLKGKNEETLKRLFRGFQPSNTGTSAFTSSSSSYKSNFNWGTWASWYASSSSAAGRGQSKKNPGNSSAHSSKYNYGGNYNNFNWSNTSAGTSGGGSGRKWTFSDSSSSTESDYDPWARPAPKRKRVWRPPAGLLVKFRCYRCGKKFTDKEMLIDHRKMHLTGFNCSACKQPFVTKAGAKGHITKTCGRNDPSVHIIHRDAPVRKGRKTKEKEQKEPAFLCAICGKGFETSIKKVDHEKLHLSGFECSQCSTLFRTFPGANLHVKLNCGKTCPDAHVLKNGVRFVNDEKNKDEAGKAKKSQQSKAEATATSSCAKTMKEDFVAAEEKAPTKEEPKPTSSTATATATATKIKKEKKIETFTCSYCTKKFGNIRAAQDHVEKMCAQWGAQVFKV